MTFNVMKVDKPIKIVFTGENQDYGETQIDYANGQKLIYRSKITVPMYVGGLIFEEPRDDGSFEYDKYAVIEPYTVAAFIRIAMGLGGTKRQCRVQPVVSYTDLKNGDEIPIPKDDLEVEAIFRDADEVGVNDGKPVPRYDENTRRIEL